MKTKFLLLISAIVLMTSIVLAVHVITPTSYSTNESVETVFNISVNNSDEGQAANITSVNITIPSTFTFANGTNGTNSTLSELVFTNTTTSLIWTNLTGYIVNGSEIILFWFNATPTFPGDYNITVNLTNVTDSYPYYVAVEVNDITNPTATTGTSPIDYYNSSSANVTFDLKCTDAYLANDLVLWGNWSSAWHANQTNATATNDSYWNITVSNIVDGIYKWTSWCNDSTGNSDWATANRTLTVDTVAPVASAVCYPATVKLGATTTCSCSGTDATSGVSTTTASSTPSTSTLGTFTYNCTATDFAGNSHDTSTTYTATTDNTDSGGSSTSSTTTFWTKGTQVLTDEQFAESFTKELSAKQRFKVKVDSQDHHVGVIELTSTTATVNISSDPQQAILTVGDERKFEVSGDEYYDISVKLNSIESSKASITIQSVHELITEDAITTEEDLQEVGETTKEDEGIIEKSNTSLWWTIGIIILVLIIIGIIYGKNINKK